MYAVVKTGGKQYRVAEQDKIIVSNIDADEGSRIVLDQVLLLSSDGEVTVGAPTVSGAVIGATVLRQTRGPKIMVFRRKRRKNFRRVRGHRQDLTLLQIDEISPGGDLKKATAKAPKKKPAAKKQAAAS